MLKICQKISIVLLALFLVGCASTPTRESTGQYIDSSAITTQVKSKLLTTTDIKSFQIKVNTYKSEVQLSGFVNTKKQSQKAEAVAKSVEGVTSVKNNLVVKAKK